MSSSKFIFAEFLKYDIFYNILLFNTTVSDKSLAFCERQINFLFHFIYFLIRTVYYVIAKEILKSYLHVVYTQSSLHLLNY